MLQDGLPEHLVRPPWYQAWPFAIVLWLFCAAPTPATTLVPMTVEDLTRSSVATVIGTVEDLTGVRSRDGAIFTLVRVAVQEVLTGDLTGFFVTLKEDGGDVAGQQEIVFGTPTFQRGEHVLLFLTTRRDGSLRTNHLALGKFHLAPDANGMPQASQQFGPGALVLVTPDAPAPLIRPVPLSDVLDAIRGASGAGRSSRAVAPAVTILTQPLEATDPSLPHEFTREFTLETSPRGRFFEPDEGTPVSFLIDTAGDATLGLAPSRQAVDDAFAAWTGVSTASITLEDGGLTTDLSMPCPGPNKIRFNDPDGTIPDPSVPDPADCHGVLAIGGFCSSSFESKVFNGTTFPRALRGFVTFANGWQGCTIVALNGSTVPLWTQCNVAEIATHELGHTIGLGHSSEADPEPNPVLADATMYFRAHFDGRCAAVRSDDIDGVTFIYPLAMPPTITTASPLPDGSQGVFYSQSLAATGGTGSFTWSLARGNLAYLSLTADGVLSGVPSMGGTGFVDVTATDSTGDSHTKLFYITVSGTPSSTPASHTATPTVTTTATQTSASTPTATATSTASATATPTPSPSATASCSPTSTPTVQATLTPGPHCAGDCNGSGGVTVDELLTLADIALGNRRADGCVAGEASQNGLITVDKILKAANAALNGCPWPAERR